MRELRVYVSSGCLLCQRAREIASLLQGRYPGVRIEVVDADDAPEESLPESVIAFPAYLLDGDLISLGNPSLGSLRERLAALMPPRS